MRSVFKDVYYDNIMKLHKIYEYLKTTVRSFAACKKVGKVALRYEVRNQCCNASMDLHVIRHSQLF